MKCLRFLIIFAIFLETDSRGGARGGSRGGSRGSTGRSRVSGKWTKSSGSRFGMSRTLVRTVNRPSSHYNSYRTLGAGAIKSNNFRKYATGAAVGYIASRPMSRPYYFYNRGYFGGYGYGNTYDYEFDNETSKICSINLNSTKINFKENLTAEAMELIENDYNNVTVLFECELNDLCCDTECCQIEVTREIGGFAIFLIVAACIIFLIDVILMCRK